MCGRFALAVEKHILEMLFDLELRWELAPRFNIAPSQEILAVRLNRSGEKEFARLQWSLLPAWSGKRSGGYRMINARAETAAVNTAFKDAFTRRRALIPASGFYEWAKLNGGKQPYYIRMAAEEPFLIGAIWESWHGDNKVIESCALLTTAANDTVAPLHHRMPLIIKRELQEKWLDPRTTADELRKMTVPFPHFEQMVAHPVSRLVNNPANDNPQCIEETFHGHSE